MDVCFDKKLLLGVLLIAVILFSYQHYNLAIKYKKLKLNKKKEQNIKRRRKIVQKEIVPTQSISNVPIIVETPTVIPPPIDIIRDYDYRKIYDPLEDPTRRPDRYTLGPFGYHGIGNIGYRNTLFDYPTRGYPDNFRWMGLLMCHGNTDKSNKILKLFGRPKYYGNTSEYEYYTMINSGHDQIKVNLEQKKELYDDDKVNVKELGTIYTVQLNKKDDLKYVPF